jgi:murein L,D-transpeptidase YcbB/YkuD
MTRTIACAATLLVASSAFAAAATAPKKKPRVPAPPVVAPLAKSWPDVSVNVYDRITDPQTAAIRAALAAIPKSVDKKQAAGIRQFYAERGFLPVWTTGGTISIGGKAVIARLAEADTDGLDPRDYRTPPSGLGGYAPASLAVLADADVTLSTAVAGYAHDAYAGRLVPGDVSPNIGWPAKTVDAAAVLASVTTADDPATVLADYNPQQKEFILLRGKLAEMRAAKAETEEFVTIPEGPLLKPGMTDARVVLLRKRLELPTDVADADVYDDTVVAAVQAFQKSARIKADGLIGKGTLASLNKRGPDPVPLILANMERWRWMPRNLGNFYVRVNIPNFDLDVYSDGNVIFNTRIVVGKVDLQTPIFSDRIQFAVVNPSWSVPSSIIAKEYLPALRNGGVPRGFDVFAKIGGRFRPVDPFMVNWATVSANDIQLRQPPGERNALGVIKFMFPNKYAVYLHDTPSKALFKNDYRAYSHGCMRVMNPWDFADVLFTQEKGWTVARLKKLVGGSEKRVDFPRPINVHITYFTAWVDDSGALQTRPDLYGHDRRVEQALGLLPTN